MLGEWVDAEGVEGGVLGDRHGRWAGRRHRWLWVRLAVGLVVRAGILTAISGLAALFFGLFFFAASSFGFVPGSGIACGLVGEFVGAVGDCSGQGSGGDVEQYCYGISLVCVGEGGVGGEDGGVSVGDGFGVQDVDGAVGECFCDGWVGAEPVAEGDLVGGVAFGDADGVAVPAFDGGVSEFEGESSAFGFGE